MFAYFVFYIFWFRFFGFGFLVWGVFVFLGVIFCFQLSRSVRILFFLVIGLFGILILVFFEFFGLWKPVDTDLGGGGGEHIYVYIYIYIRI